MTNIVNELLSFFIKEPVNYPELNLHGEALEPCNTKDMAMTGYTRDGFCSHHKKDEGSHHICVTNIRTTNTNKNNFCKITGQENWCDTNGKCHDGRDCRREKWCVCEWAFADFLTNNNCKDFDIDTRATNKLVLEHYKKHLDSEKHKKAYNCIMEKMSLVS